MRKVSLPFLLLSLLTACLAPVTPPAPRAESHPWAGALRSIDRADTPNPAHDITAVYLRQGERHLEIRVDLLAFQSRNDLFLDIKIGDDSSPGTAPINIHVPSEENPARIELDQLLATVIVEIPQSDIPSRPRVDVSTPEDKITGLTLDGPVPAQSAPLLLTFHDTFAGRFPGEALRSWDGAHTGPLGSRHGLKHLLDAVAATRVPVVLLDLKAPENLSALDAMGLLPQIRQMEQDGLLLLPDQGDEETLFGFSPNHFTLGEIKSRTSYAFSFTSDTAHLYRPFFRQTTYIPIATETDNNQPSPDGPSLEVRRALLETALNADENDLLVLGGDLDDSTWGSPDMAGETLAYFASRPYVNILSAQDLLDFPTKSGEPERYATPQEEELRQLETHYRALTQPVLDSVEEWQGSPLASCATDLDKDGQPECVFANDKYLAVLDPQGARLTYLFAVTRDSNSRYSQLVGPSWQVAVGLSNPALWDFSAGEAADPGAYPGAFADADDPFKSYEPVIEENRVVFNSLDGTRIKIFDFTQDGIQVEYQTQETVITRIPLLVEPETRFTPSWAHQYVQEKTPSGVAWGLRNGPMINVQLINSALRQAQSGMDFHAFNDSLSLLSTPEDPDFSYPPGHSLPFPLALVEIEMQDGYLLRLERLP